MLQGIFSHLYPLVSFVTVYAYMPQIRLLLKADGPSRDLSARAWFLWIVGGIVTFGYSLFCSDDTSFRFISFVSLILTVVIFGLIVYNRNFRFARKTGAKAEPVTVAVRSKQ